MILDKLVLMALIFAALWTVMTRSLLKAALGLAVTSAIIAVILFRLESPLAGVFELSVCAGLITAVFVSAISLMKPLTHKETMALSQARIKRYWLLPVIVALAAFMFARSAIPASIRVFPEAMAESVQEVLWNSRVLDLFGQIVIVLAGVFGTVILFRESNKK
jgi:NADH-quinone oxidoreductase subunit J